MAIDVITLQLAKKAAAGAVSGVSSMSVTGQTLYIYTTNGQTLTMTFPTPADGVSVTDIQANAQNKIVFTMSDGTVYTTGIIPTVKGDKGNDGADGVSPIANVARNAADDGVIVTITDSTGTTRANVYDGSAANTLDYTTQITNKPKLNGVELNGDKSLSDVGITIPEKVSDLTNDSGYITASDIPTIDTTLSTTSEKAVQNKAVTTEIRSMQEIQNSMVTDINTNTNAITVLNGAATVEGSVKKQIQDAVSNIDKLTKKIVAELPLIAEAKEDVIYMIEDTTAAETTYIQYTLVEDESGDKVFALVGSTKTDLGEYYTKSEVDAIALTKQDTITGAASTVTSMDLSAAKAVVTNSGGKIATSTVTAAELDNLQGVTANIQQQLDAKQAIIEYDSVPTTDSDKLIKSKDLKTAFDAKQDILTMDTTPTAGSLNAVTSGGIFTALNDKMDTMTIDTSPHENSENLVTSGGVYSALQNVTVDVATTAAAGIVKPDGTSITVDLDGTIHGEITPTATISTAGKVKPDGETITIDEDGTIHGSNTLTEGNGIDITDNVISAETVTFTGTQAEWEALTTAEKQQYSVCNLTDDANGTDYNTGWQEFSFDSISSSQTITKNDSKYCIKNGIVYLILDVVGAFSLNHQSNMFATLPSVLHPSQRQFSVGGVWGGSIDLSVGGFITADGQLQIWLLSTQETFTSGTHIVHTFVYPKD